MFTLFECMTEGCSTNIIRKIVEETGDWRVFVFYWGYIMFFVFAVMNLFTAMFVENTMEAAKVNSDKIRRQRDNQSAYMAKKLGKLLHKLRSVEKLRRQDTAQSYQRGVTGESNGHERQLDENQVSREAFMQALGTPEVSRFLDDLELPENDRADLFDVLDADANNV